MLVTYYQGCHKHLTELLQTKKIVLNNRYKLSQMLQSPRVTIFLFGTNFDYENSVLVTRFTGF